MKNIVILTIVAALFLFSGCMAVSMFGGGDNDQSHSSSTTVQKEVTSNGMKAKATFPPLILKKETTFTLKITDAGTGKPVSNLAVWFHSSFTYQPMEHHSGMMNDSSHHSGMEERHGVNYDRELEDTTNSGIFSVPFTPTQSGEYVMAFHIVWDGKKLAEDIIIEQKMVAAAVSHSSRGMMGSFGSYAIIAGAAMGALMVYFLVSGSSMF